LLSVRKGICFFLALRPFDFSLGRMGAFWGIAISEALQPAAWHCEDYVLIGIRGTAW
jgi:hypothetical protein